MKYRLSPNAFFVLAVVWVFPFSISSCDRGRGDAERDVRETTSDPQVGRRSGALDAWLLGDRSQSREVAKGQILAFEDSLQRLPDHSRTPEWLWHVGRLTREHLAEIHLPSDDTPWAETRRAQYWNNEPDASLVYNGWHFRQLVRRYPEHALADDAGYELTRLAHAGECEGFVPCYIERELGPLNEFLRTFPHSPFAPEAVARANEAFTSNLEAVEKDPDPIYELDDEEMRRLIATYDETAGRLPDELRAAAYEVIAPLWVRFGNAERAREMYRTLLTNLAPYADTAAVRARLLDLGGETRY